MPLWRRGEQGHAAKGAGKKAVSAASRGLTDADASDLGHSLAATPAGRGHGIRNRHPHFEGGTNALEGEIPASRVVHVALDNLATHKTPEARRRLKKHLRWAFRVTPSSASWPNAVDHAPRATRCDVFAKLTKRSLKLGVVHSVVDLQSAIT